MIARLMELLRRAAAIGRRGRLDRDLEDDLLAHFDLLVDDLVSRGLDPDAARREARLRFGTMASAMEAHRDARSFRVVETLARDVRYATRLLRRQPWLTTAVVLILAIGIAVPASGLSLLNGFLFRAPVSRDPEAYARLIRPGRGSSASASLAEYLAFREQSTAFREIAAWSSSSLSAPLGQDDATPVPGLLVSCNLLRLAGVDVPVVGRLFVEDDCQSDAPAAVISEAIWRTRFGADPAVPGRTIPYGTARLVVIGVASVPPMVNQWDDPDFMPGVWLPYTAQTSVKDAMRFQHGANLLSADNAHRSWLEIAGLLAPGGARAAAAADLHRIQASLPSPDRQRDRPLALSDGSRWASVDADDAWSIFVMALTLPVVIMLMTCVNAAALLLSRAVGRHREMAIRRALGTGKAGLLRMLLTEHLVIAAIAGLVSLAIVNTLPRIIVWQFDVAATFGPAASLAPDWRVLAVIGIAVLIAALLSGLAPAREALRAEPGDSLLARLRSSADGRARSRRALAGIQLAACVVPLVVAVTFARAANRYTHQEFARRDLIVATVPAGGARTLPLSAIADRLEAVPGVGTATYGGWLPLIIEDAERMQIPGQSLEVTPLLSRVGPSFFDVFDIPILAGQPPPATAVEMDPTPVVVSRQFARRFFSEATALGQILQAGHDRSMRRLTIVGIAGDRPIGQAVLGGALKDGSVVYEPMDPAASSGTLVIRPSAPVDEVRDALAPALRDLVGMPIPITTFQAHLEERVAGVRGIQKILIGLGAVALVLAVIGVIGSVAFDVRQRRKEFAVQMALGARPWTIRRGVIRSGLRGVPISLASGLFASWGAVRGAEYLRMLPPVSTGVDPVPYAIAVLLLVTVAAATLLALAYPAGHVDPLPALREE